MPTELTKLTLTELSLVDRPANPLAMAPIFKADTSNGEGMTDEVIKMSEEMDKKIKAYMKEKGCDRKTAEQALMKAWDDAEQEAEKASTLKAENEKLRKGLLDEGYKITKEGIEKSAPVEYIEVEGEKIEKSAVPAVILKQLEAAKEKEAQAAIAKKADETLPNFKQEVAVELMKADLSEDSIAVLKALDEQLGKQMEEIGKSTDADGDMTDPNEKMDALVKAHAEEHKVSKAQAYAAVSKTDAGKALINAIYKKD